MLMADSDFEVLLLLQSASDLAITRVSRMIGTSRCACTEAK